ncbi:MAG: TldD/PmbA family protein [Alphaproteobacteria bacterium]|nr:TldD/PmbA family protein [Alphaproteobacteria bacterium]
MDQPGSTRDQEIAQELVDRARRAGAEAANALIVRSSSLSHSQRKAALEKLEREESCDLGLRVLIGKHQATVSSTDLSLDGFDALVDRAIAMARAVPEDPYCGLAEPEEICTLLPELEMADEVEPAPAELIARAQACEGAALAVAGIANSDGADASWGRTQMALVASNGFAGSYARTRHSVSVSVIAGEGARMERDYDYTTAVYAEDLENPELVGKRAGSRTVRRLNPRRVPTQQVPVVYESRIAGGLLRHLVGAISGGAITRRTSFLKEKLGQHVFGTGITVVDDPHRPRGLASRPFDGEGVTNRRREIIADGVLTTWLLDLASARQLGLKSTGHAGRGLGGGTSATNLYLLPGSATPKELIADIKQGFFITELMGMGANQITGDYSRGAAGFWIENGVLVYPVSELTVAGNLKDMFLRLTPANDLKFRGGADAPTVRIEGMTVAGTN